MSDAILVIKLGALGDFVQALWPFQAIRRHHRDARLVLLTTAPFRAAAEASGWFDAVWIDDRPGPLRVDANLALRRRLLSGGFKRVYDLQTSDRSSWYFHMLFGAQPEWSGIARGCSHPHANPNRDTMHTMERQAEQLAAAGIPAMPPPDLDWFDADIAGFDLADRFALLAPGGAPHRPAKRWPPQRFAALATRLAESGLQPALLGAADDEAAVRGVMDGCPAAVSLIGRTSLLDLGGLARRAALAVGNDTGPMHIAAAVGCRSVVLFSNESDPALCAQRGPDVAILHRASLADLPVGEVEAALRLS